MTSLLRTIETALEAHLVNILEEYARQEALTYLRGLKSVLAQNVTDGPSPTALIKSDSLALHLRIEDLVARTRRQQTQDAGYLDRLATLSSSL